MKPMKPVEHSRMLFLIDALCVAPNKSYTLIDMASRGKMSKKYSTYLNRLRAVLDDEVAIVKIAKQIKLEML